MNDLISNCCEATIIEETDICVLCKEHCDLIENPLHEVRYLKNMNEEYYKLLDNIEIRLNNLCKGYNSLKNKVGEEIQNERETIDFLENGPGGIDP